MYYFPNILPLCVCSYDNEEPEDVLGLVHDGESVRPWADLSSTLADKVRTVSCCDLVERLNWELEFSCEIDEF
jgi:hypothetical protein